MTDCKQLEDGRLHHELGNKSRVPILVPIGPRAAGDSRQHAYGTGQDAGVRKKKVVMVAEYGDGGRIYLFVYADCRGCRESPEVAEKTAVGAGNRFEEAFRNADSAFRRRYGL